MSTQGEMLERLKSLERRMEALEKPPGLQTFPPDSTVLSDGTVVVNVDARGASSGTAEAVRKALSLAPHAVVRAQRDRKRPF